MVAAVCVLVAVVFVLAKASLSSDPSALAKIGLPWGGGSVKSVSVVTGPHSTWVPVKPTGGPVILPARKVAADHSYQVGVVIRRPGWISWLAGKTETLNKTVTTPVASLRSRYVTLGRSGALRLGFKQPVRVISYGAQGHFEDGTTSASAFAATHTPAAAQGHGSDARATTSSATCHTGQLTARFREGPPGVGQEDATLVLTNRSSTKCYTYGYVGLGLLGYRNELLHSRVLRARKPRPALILLPPHSQVHTVLRWSIIPGGGDPVSGCPIPLQIEITPPAQRTHLILSWGDRSEVCDRGTISVSALVNGQ